MTPLRRLPAALARRASAVRRVAAASAAYAAANGGEMGVRDAVAFPAAVAVYLALAALAPGALSGDSFLDASPHGPAGPRSPK